MKLLIASVLIFSFAFFIGPQILAFDHSESACPLAIVRGVPCPENTNPVADLGYHIGGILTGVSVNFDLSSIIFTLATVLFFLGVTLFTSSRIQFNRTYATLQKGRLKELNLHLKLIDPIARSLARGTLQRKDATHL